MLSDGFRRCMAYCDDVLTAKTRTPGELEKLAVQRFMRDIDDLDAEYVLDIERAGRVVKFVENLPFTRGKPAERGIKERKDVKIRLHPWQCWLVYSLFGLVHIETGFRRVRSAYVEIPRASGKSTLMASLGLYALLADKEPSPQCYVSATSAKQARIVMDYAKAMVLRRPALMGRARIQIRGGESTTPRIISHVNNGKFEGLVKETGQGVYEGMRAHFAVLDEFHVHKTIHAWEALRNSHGDQSQPMLVAITTAGNTIGGPAHQNHEYLKKILKGEVDDPSFGGVIYTPSAAQIKKPHEGEPGWTNPEVWRTANPSLGAPEATSMKAYEEMATKARHDPEARTQFMIKQLNVWQTASEEWIPLETWLKCAVPPPENQNEVWPMSWSRFRGLPFWMSLDLATTNDIVALTVLWRLNDKVWTRNLYWIPESKLDENPKYRGWAEDGWLNVCSGPAIDQDDVKKRIKRLLKQGELMACHYDRWQGAALAGWIVKRLIKKHDDENAESKVLKITQSGTYEHNFLDVLKGWALEGRLRYDGNPVTTWMMGNATIVAKPNGEYRLDRRDRRAKIDGLDSLWMAAAASELEIEEEESSSGVQVIDWDAV